MSNCLRCAKPHSGRSGLLGNRPQADARSATCLMSDFDPKRTLAAEGKSRSMDGYRSDPEAKRPTISSVLFDASLTITGLAIPLWLLDPAFAGWTKFFGAALGAAVLVGSRVDLTKCPPWVEGGRQSGWASAYFLSRFS